MSCWWRMCAGTCSMFTVSDVKQWVQRGLKAGPSDGLARSGGFHLGASDHLHR